MTGIEFDDVVNTPNARRLYLAPLFSSYLSFANLLISLKDPLVRTAFNRTFKVEFWGEVSSTMLIIGYRFQYPFFSPRPR